MLRSTSNSKHCDKKSSVGAAVPGARQGADKDMREPRARPTFAATGLVRCRCKSRGHYFRVQEEIGNI